MGQSSKPVQKDCFQLALQDDNVLKGAFSIQRITQIQCGLPNQTLAHPGGRGCVVHRPGPAAKQRQRQRHQAEWLVVLQLASLRHWSVARRGKSSWLLLLPGMRGCFVLDPLANLKGIAGGLGSCIFCFWISANFTGTDGALGCVLVFLAPRIVCQVWQEVPEAGIRLGRGRGLQDDHGLHGQLDLSDERQEALLLLIFRP